MKRTSAWVIGTVLSVAPTMAMAASLDDSIMYVGFQFADVTLDVDDLSDDAEPTAAIGRFGYFMTEQVAIEGRLGMDLSEDTVGFDDSGFTSDVDVDLDRLQGLYAVGYLPLVRQASLYGLVGYTDARATITGRGVAESESDSGLSYGVGGEFRPTERIGLNIEYTQYLDESDFELSAVSVGMRFDF